MGCGGAFFHAYEPRRNLTPCHRKQPGREGQQPQQEEKPPVPQESPSFPDIDLATLQKITGFAKQSSIDSNQQALLKALRPYLTHERIVKLEKAMRAAKLAGLASSFLGNGGLTSILGR